MNHIIPVRESVVDEMTVNNQNTHGRWRLQAESYLIIGEQAATLEHQKIATC